MSRMRRKILLWVAALFTEVTTDDDDTLITDDGDNIIIG